MNVSAAHFETMPERVRYFDTTARRTLSYPVDLDQCASGEKEAR